MDDYEYWMQYALEQAQKALEKNEVPVGAVLVYDNEIIAMGHNQSISLHDPSAHAEIQCLRHAGAYFQNYRFPNTTLFVTHEPCCMCAGALLHARINTVVFGSYDNKNGSVGSVVDLSSLSIANHRYTVIGGVRETECALLLKNFFKQKRL